MVKTPKKYRTSSNPDEILLVHLGRVHDDTDAITHTLETKHHFKVNSFNLLETGFDNIDLSKVAAIDLKDCRGWQKNINHFRNQLKILQRKIAETGREIPIVNSPEMFEWVASKEYLSALAQKGISIIPTQFVHPQDVFPDIFHMLDNAPSNMLVLKPAMGSRAADVIFIIKKSDDEFDITCPKPLSEGPTPHTITVTRQALTNYLLGYREKLFVQQHQSAILVQEYCHGMETSAAYIGSKAHFVDRPKGNTLIAHEDFGGRNILNNDPHPDIVSFAGRVRKGLPDHLKDSPYLRVDMIHDGLNTPTLLEIEAGSVRLFLIEANRTEDYADMLVECAQKAKAKNISVAI